MSGTNSFVFRKVAKKYLKKNQRKSGFVNYAKARNIILLFDYADGSVELINRIVKSLKEDQKQVVAYGFLSGKEMHVANNPDIVLLNKKNIGLWKKPEKSILEKLKNNHYDILIDLSLNQSLPLLYLALYAEASLKISSKMADVPLFDFILDIHRQREQGQMSGDALRQFLFEEIIFYLKSIQTND